MKKRSWLFILFRIILPSPSPIYFIHLPITFFFFLIFFFFCSIIKLCWGEVPSSWGRCCPHSVRSHRLRLVSKYIFSCWRFCNNFRSSYWLCFRFLTFYVVPIIYDNVFNGFLLAHYCLRAHLLNSFSFNDFNFRSVFRFNWHDNLLLSFPLSSRIIFWIFQKNFIGLVLLRIHINLHWWDRIEHSLCSCLFFLLFLVRFNQLKSFF